MKPPTKAQIAEAESRAQIAEAAATEAEAAAERARVEAIAAKQRLEHLQRLVQLAKWPDDLRAALIADPATWSEEGMMKLHRRGLTTTDRSRDGRLSPKRALNISGGMFLDSLKESA